MKDNRPVNLDITTIRWPLAAIGSIIHRISGVFIFLNVALLLYLLDLSLQSQAGFDQAQAMLDNFVVKLVAWAVLAALLYHLIAGIKHLLMDLGIGETKQGARISTLIVMSLSGIAMVIAGIWPW
ncbi:MAG TPA: succinate dehydrogenase, cytochrome b556 subunit [Gammaproteobacteria bacterium]|nr:succinate dehydrogenase, cytochrome b556 subunit [Gammaproteobacteria bacterium]MDP6732292.1 succinate dehydrogenase, cytochrome b556 subunit [Gammaproteobacteria bacterium]HAJ75871.1 succinate dehydrogenase, cytochrome b556 subunit [Gammaproteobacteria bacterium]